MLGLIFWTTCPAYKCDFFNFLPPFISHTFDSRPTIYAVVVQNNLLYPVLDCVANGHIQAQFKPFPQKSLINAKCCVGDLALSQLHYILLVCFLFIFVYPSTDCLAWLCYRHIHSSIGLTTFSQQYSFGWVFNAASVFTFVSDCGTSFNGSTYDPATDWLQVWCGSRAQFFWNDTKGRLN